MRRERIERGDDSEDVLVSARGQLVEPHERPRLFVGGEVLAEADERGGDPVRRDDIERTLHRRRALGRLQRLEQERAADEVRLDRGDVARPRIGRLSRSLRVQRRERTGVRRVQGVDDLRRLVGRVVPGRPALLADGTAGLVLTEPLAERGVGGHVAQELCRGARLRGEATEARQLTPRQLPREIAVRRAQHHRAATSWRRQHRHLQVQRFAALREADPAVELRVHARRGRRDIYTRSLNSGGEQLASMRGGSETAYGRDLGAGDAADLHLVALRRVRKLPPPQVSVRPVEQQQSETLRPANERIRIADRCMLRQPHEQRP